MENDYRCEICKKKITAEQMYGMKKMKDKYTYWHYLCYRDNRDVQVKLSSQTALKLKQYLLKYPEGRWQTEVISALDA